MFGYVVAAQKRLSEEQLARYRQWYCGLCRALRQRSGQLSRLTLNYDITFLVMVLSSLYEPDDDYGKERCLMHPVHTHDYVYNKFCDYGADMTLALAYHNCMDDYRDDKSYGKLAYAKLMRKKYEKIFKQYPRQCETMERKLQELADAECSGEYAPDAAANSFGSLMGELFVYDPGDFWADTLRRMGEALGRFVYMLDACVDLERDIKKGRYNPLLRPDGTYMDKESMEDILTVLIGECAMEFERLPLVQDTDIMRNIIYYGVWQRLSEEENKDPDGEKETDVNG